MPDDIGKPKRTRSWSVRLTPDEVTLIEHATALNRVGAYLPMCSVVMRAALLAWARKIIKMHEEQEEES